MSKQYIILILINIIFQVNGHQLIINCINSCKQSYNITTLCSSFFNIINNNKYI